MYQSKTLKKFHSSVAVPGFDHGGKGVTFSTGAWLGWVLLIILYLGFFNFVNKKYKKRQFSFVWLKI